MRGWRWVALAFVLGLPLGAQEMAGDTPSYVPLSQCPPAIALLAEELKLPADRIHRCLLQPMNLGSRSAELAQIEYGEAQDCPSGCFYESWIGVILSGNPAPVMELPGPRREHIAHLAALRLYPDDARHPGLRCDEKPEERFDISVIEHAGTVAWQLTLRRPWRCSWNTPRGRVTRTTLGSLLVYLRDGQTVFELDGLRHSVK